LWGELDKDTKYIPYWSGNNEPVFAKLRPNLNHKSPALKVKVVEYDKVISIGTRWSGTTAIDFERKVHAARHLFAEVRLSRRNGQRRKEWREIL
jgi:hypothetical protein